MTKVAATNFLGIPIEGDINGAEKRVPQKPVSELEPLMRAVLDDPTIKAIGWSQYTPYFNDGEPCVFNVYTPWFLTVDDPDPNDVEDDSEYQVSYYSGHPSLGKRESDWIGEWPNRVRFFRDYEGPDEARFHRCMALSDAIESGAFDDVLLAAFGDHAEIVARRDGITVGFYAHD